jgi:hypothetical protein
MTDWQMRIATCEEGSMRKNKYTHRIHTQETCIRNTPKAISSFGHLSFQFSAANDWNELQKSLKLETHISLTNFKHQLSEQLIRHHRQQRYLWAQTHRRWTRQD